MFYFLSFVAQEKELEYANGTAVVEEKKKKAKKSKKQDEIQAENEQNIVEDQTQVGQEGEETTQIPVDQKSDEEVL